MVSYFKTQWWRLLCALACLIYCIVIVCTSTAVADSVEGVYMLLGDVINCGAWFLASCFWCIISFVAHNSACIEKLDKRVEALENRAITNIDQVKPNHFIVKRRLGPDKEDTDHGNQV